MSQVDIEVLRKIKSGEEIIVTKRGKPVAKITALGAKRDIDWPDFFEECIELKPSPGWITVTE